MLDQLLQETFATQLALFRSQLHIMVNEVFRPLLEEASSVCLERVVGLDPTPHADPVVEEKAYLYGYFSPLASLSTSSLPIASTSEASEVVTMWGIICGAPDEARIIIGLDGGHDTIASAV
jgi:hypothetical protein